MLTAPAYSPIGIPLIPRALQPAAETTYATVLCANLRGYDALVEQLSPVTVVPLLGEFFSILTCAVLEGGGQIFHLGDAGMMAGFGVGDSRHTQIHEALITARTIQQRFTLVRATWLARHSIDAGVGIGIHRGEVAIGMFGPPEHTSLTLVGDTANVAVQLCKRARSGEVLHSGAAHLPQENACMPNVHLPPLQLRGRSVPLDVWCTAAPARSTVRRVGHRASISNSP